MQDAIELSVVVPCRNEHETIGSTIAEIETMLADLECPAEIIAVDNNSSDASATIIAGTSARLVKEPMPGYGAALKRGIAESRGRFVIFGDADASYDFSQSPAMLHRLQCGDSLVLGCRLPAGNGNIEPGAMPWLHRHLGNPAISWLCRRLFSVPVHDVYCGLRGFARADYEKLSINSTSMTFAVEMVIRFTLAQRRVTETPITLRRDRRIHTRPHLQTFRDGFRTLWTVFSIWRDERRAESREPG